MIAPDTAPRIRLRQPAGAACSGRLHGFSASMKVRRTLWPSPCRCWLAVFFSSLNGRVSRRHGHDSRVGRDCLPEQPGIGPTASPDGKASCRHRRDSRIARNYLPEHFGMGAHDGGIYRF